MIPRVSPSLIPIYQVSGQHRRADSPGRGPALNRPPRAYRLPRSLPIFQALAGPAFSPSPVEPLPGRVGHTSGSQMTYFPGGNS